jgi:hypothetical protein
LISQITGCSQGTSAKDSRRTGVGDITSLDAFRKLLLKKAPESLWTAIKEDKRSFPQRKRSGSQVHHSPVVVTQAIVRPVVPSVILVPVLLVARVVVVALLLVAVGVVVGVAVGGLLLGLCFCGLVSRCCLQVCGGLGVPASAAVPALVAEGGVGLQGEVEGVYQGGRGLWAVQSG